MLPATCKCALASSGHPAAPVGTREPRLLRLAALGRADARRGAHVACDV